MPLNADPDDLVSRNRYAYWAYRCRQWKVADDQLKILGGNLDIGMWGGAPSLKEALNLIQANIDRMRMQNMSD